MEKVTPPVKVPPTPPTTPTPRPPPGLTVGVWELEEDTVVVVEAVGEAVAEDVVDTAVEGERVAELH